MSPDAGPRRARPEPARRGRRRSRLVGAPAVAEVLRTTLLVAVAGGGVVGLVLGGVARAVLDGQAGARALGGVLLVSVLGAGLVGVRIGADAIEDPDADGGGSTARRVGSAVLDLGAALGLPCAAAGLVAFGAVAVLAPDRLLAGAAGLAGTAVGLGLLVGALPGLLLAAERALRGWEGLRGPHVALVVVLATVTAPLATVVGLVRAVGRELGDGAASP